MKNSSVLISQKILDSIEKILVIICSILFSGVVLLSALEIFTRYFLNYSSTISGELGLILMTWVYFLGFIVLFKRKEDIVMEYFYKKFPLPIQNIIEWLTQFAILIFFIFLVWNSIKFYIMTSKMEHPFLPIKYSYTVQPILLSSFLGFGMALYFFCINTVSFIKWLNNKKRK